MHSQPNRLLHGGHRLRNVQCRDLELLGETELAEGDEVLVAEHVVLVLRPEHHRAVVGRVAFTLRALKTGLQAFLYILFFVKAGLPCGSGAPPV